MKTVLSLLILLLISLTALTAQTPLDKSRYYSFGAKFYNEAHILPNCVSDSVNVLLIFKIRNEALTFTQVNPLDGPGNYKAISSVEYAFKDKDGIIRKRLIKRDTIYLDDYEKTISKKDYVNGFIITTLAKGKYKAGVIISDHNNYKVYEEEFSLEAKSIDPGSLNVFPPVFAKSVKELPQNKFDALARGGDVAFNESGVYALVPIANAGDIENLNYQIIKVDNKSDKSEMKTFELWPQEVDLSGNIGIMHDKYLDVDSSSSSSERIIVQILDCGDNALQSSSDKQFSADEKGLIQIELPSSTIVPGNYKLIISDNKTLKKEFEFKVVWFDEPLSLKDPDYAARSMYYVLTEEEYDALKSGSDKEILRKIYDYWKSQDPTPATPYNEAMNAYFQRVDFAFYNYRTIKERDGSQTGRGKIYILYGEPDSVKQNLDEKNPQEIWTYKRLNKQFVFEMISAGIYKLTMINEI